MLTALIPPTTRNLMAPETVLSRLGLPDSALPDLILQVEEASAIVCRYLGYECAYGTWEESFIGLPGSTLFDLGARPAWSIVSVSQNLQGGAGLLATDAYQLRRGPYGESSIYKPSGWEWRVGQEFSLVGGGEYMVPDYTAQYTAGWWLPEMPIEDIPAGVQPFPPELRSDFLAVMKWYRGRFTHNSAVKRMREDGAEVEYWSYADLDPRSGIPQGILSALPFYRRAV